MKIQFVLISALALANAKPTKDNFYEGEKVLPTPLVKLDDKIFTKMVGACTMKEFSYSTSKCQRTFYLSFRKDKTTPCDKRFQQLTKCYLKELRKCYETILQVKDLNDFINKFGNSFQDFQKVQCGETAIDISNHIKQIPKPDECPKGTMRKFEDCAQMWYRLFRKNRGSLKLCDRYQKYAECSRSVIDQCTFDFRKSAWIFNKDLNPFCDTKQLNSQS